VQLAGYTLEERLAVGGMAEVFSATRLGPGGFAKRVAIKRVLPDLSRDPSFVAMFLEEARLASQLNSANLVQVFDFGEEHGAYFMVMELVEGLDLAALLAKCGALPVPATMHLARGLCAALRDLHGAVGDDGTPLGIVHRDVTPANVLLSRRGVVKLGDFGVAKAKARSLRTARDAIKGKLAYLSPEQARGDELDARADLYGLGLVLFEALTGERYLTAENDAAFLRAAERPVWRAPSSLRPELPMALDRLLARLLAAEPERRLVSAEAVLAELRVAGLEQDLGSAQEALATLVTQALGAAPPLPAPTSARELPTATSIQPKVGHKTEVLAGQVRGQPTPRRVRAVFVGALGLAAIAAGASWWRVLPTEVVTSSVVPSARLSKPLGIISAVEPKVITPEPAPPLLRVLRKTSAAQPRLQPVPADPAPALAQAGVVKDVQAESCELARARLAELYVSLKARKLQRQDLPALSASFDRVTAQVEQGEAPLGELEDLAVAISRVTVDRVFIDAKLKRLGAALASQTLDESTRKQLTQRAQAALASTLQGRYELANEELYAIAAVLEP